MPRQYLLLQPTCIDCAERNTEPSSLVVNDPYTTTSFGPKLSGGVWLNRTWSCSSESAITNDSSFVPFTTMDSGTTVPRTETMVGENSLALRFASATPNAGAAVSAAVFHRIR